MVFLTDMIGQKLHVLPRMLEETGLGLTVSSPRCPQVLLHDSDVAAALFVFREQAIEACRCAPHAPLTRHREEVSFFLAMMTTVSEPPEEFEHLRNGLHVESCLLLGSIGGGGEALQHAAGSRDVLLARCLSLSWSSPYPIVRSLFRLRA